MKDITVKFGFNEAWELTENSHWVFLKHFLKIYITTNLPNGTEQKHDLQKNYNIYVDVKQN
jgi:hypothetical protein